jgi:hypothetical protein
VTDHCLQYRWNNRSILKLQNLENWNFKIWKIEISNLENWNFKFWTLKFQIWKIESWNVISKLKLVREAILSTCSSKMDFTDRNLLYWHFISRRAVVYLVILTWVMIWSHIACFLTKIRLFQTHFSFGNSKFVICNLKFEI